MKSKIENILYTHIHKGVIEEIEFEDLIEELEQLLKKQNYGNRGNKM